MTHAGPDLRLLRPLQHSHGRIGQQVHHPGQVCTAMCGNEEPPEGKKCRFGLRQHATLRSSCTCELWQDACPSTPSAASSGRRAVRETGTRAHAAGIWSCIAQLVGGSYQNLSAASCALCTASCGPCAPGLARRRAHRELSHGRPIARRVTRWHPIARTAVGSRPPFV